MKSHLQPLAIAANITQAANARLDQVLLTFGVLVKTFSALTAADAGARDAVLLSIEKRWSKSDQDVFIAALVLNPTIKAGPLKHSSKFNSAEIYALFVRLWVRFFREPQPDSLYRDTMNYLSGSGIYKSMAVNVTGVRGESIKMVSVKKPFDPLLVWEDSSPGGAEASTSLSRLACHLLVICPNSACCERLFSTFGNILTKLRNRTGLTTLANLAKLKMHLHLNHVETGVVRRRLKR
ncbi:hypothetical protein BOTBODRAFT_90844, partial [Botryobasidium botryosum FD-172 SS1]